jgi:hypothetical protein
MNGAEQRRKLVIRAGNSMAKGVSIPAFYNWPSGFFTPAFENWIIGLGPVSNYLSEIPYLEKEIEELGKIISTTVSHNYHEYFLKNGGRIAFDLPNSKEVDDLVNQRLWINKLIEFLRTAVSKMHEVNQEVLNQLKENNLLNTR